jgi:hypothetical protein
MRKQHSVWALGMLVFALAAAWGQDNSQQTPAGDNTNQEQQVPQPVPAYGQENAPPPISENPPLSGLDQPGLEPHAAPLSYIQPGATVSESVDSNVANAVGSGQVASVTRALGSLTLQRLWSHYDLALDYIGGVGYYDLQGQGFKALQQADLDQKITWKRGELSLRDSFSFLPEGSFGAAYGSLGSQGIENLGNTAFGQFCGGGIFGALGDVERLVNCSLADVSQNLTPKSALTAEGGYAFTHFYNEAGLNYIGSSEVSAQGGYNRILTPHTQIALVYGYQGFDFNFNGAAFHSHVIQGMYGHRISGRMDFLIGAGPQFTFIGVCPGGLFIGNACAVPESSDFRIGVAGQARLRYKFPRTMLEASYQRYLTGGSGFFAGAQSDIARVTVDHQLTRVWGAFADIGWARNSRLLALSASQEASCVNAGEPNPSNLPTCPGVNANTYIYGFVGAGMRRAFGHNFHAYFSYEFNELAFDHSYCGGVPVCSRIGNRSVATFGLDWTPRPIRID